MSNNAVMPLTDYQNACNAIREKTGSTDLIVSGELVTKVEDVYSAGQEAGKQAEYDEFWNTFQQNGERTSYWGAFCGGGWTDETFNPEYPIIIGDAAAYCFRDCLITRLPKITHLRTTINRIFYDAKEVQTIDCFSLPNGSDSFAQTFYGCDNLINLTVEGEIGGNGLSFQWSPNLSIESLRSIIDRLADKSADTSGTQWIVTIGSTNYAKLNEEDIQNITKKGWQFV